MSDLSRRKSTVREALGSVLKERVNVGKLRGRYLFRAAVRLVIEYIDWFGIETGDRIGDNVTANVKLARREKQSESGFSTKDRSILLIPPDRRSKGESEYVRSLLTKINAFRKYPDNIRYALAAEVHYQYVPAGRTIIRQGHKGWMMYYVVQGELQIYRDITENLTDEVKQIEAGTLVPGDMFGEISLLHKVPRTATVVSKTSVDLLFITRRTFNDNLKNHLMDEWDVLRDAFENFNYFKGWNEETMRECYIICKIIEYKPNEILLGDGRGMVHYVYFLLTGECKLIEHMLVEKEKEGRYKLYDPQPTDLERQNRQSRNKKLDLMSTDELESMIIQSLSRTRSDGVIITGDEHSTVDEMIRLVSTRKDNVNIAMDRISVITVTLQDVLNQWHEISDAVEMLMKKSSVTSLTAYPENVQTVFMQICIFYRGACFGLGEQMRNRRIVSQTPVKCLLIPRFWLVQHNRANIWERVKLFMDSKYPSKKQLLDKYITNKTWAKYKKAYVEDLLKKGRNLPNNTKYYDVPYSIRINESVNDD